MQEKTQSCYYNRHVHNSLIASQVAAVAKVLGQWCWEQVCWYVKLGYVLVPPIELPSIEKVLVCSILYRQ